MRWCLSRPSSRPGSPVRQGSWLCHRAEPPASPVDSVALRLLRTWMVSLSLQVSTLVGEHCKGCQQKIKQQKTRCGGRRQTVLSAFHLKHWFVLTARPGRFRKLPRERIRHTPHSKHSRAQDSRNQVGPEAHSA